METIKNIGSAVITIIVMLATLVCGITGSAMVAGFWGAVALDVGLTVFEWLR